MCGWSRHGALLGSSEGQEGLRGAGRIGPRRKSVMLGSVAHLEHRFLCLFHDAREQRRPRAAVPAATTATAQSRNWVSRAHKSLRRCARRCNCRPLRTSQTAARRCPGAPPQAAATSPSAEAQHTCRTPEPQAAPTAARHDADRTATLGHPTTPVNTWLAPRNSIGPRPRPTPQGSRERIRSCALRRNEAQSVTFQRRRWAYSLGTRTCR